MALISRWTLDNTPNDLLGNNNGTHGGTVVYDKQCVVGTNSLLRDGGDDYIDLGSFRFSGNTDFSISLWFKFSGSDVKVLLGDTHNVNLTQVRIASSGGTIYYQVLNTGSAVFSDLTSVTTYNDNKWHHIVICDANGTVTSYIDGVSSDISGSYTRVALTLTNSYIGKVYTGNIDDVRYYNHILTQAEVTELWLGRIPRWQTPISRWELDNNALDLYGLYNGTAVDMTYSTDTKSKGLSGSFSSSPVGYVNLSGLSLSSYDNFTMSIWVKCTSSGEMYLIHERVNSPDYRTAIVIRNDSNIRILTYVNSKFYLVDSAVTIDRYVWNHIVVTFSGSATASVSVYLNGKIYNTGSLTRYPSYQAPTFYLGAYGPSTTSKLVGLLDDVRFYDVALTADEVMNLYKSYATPIWQQPLHHWKLDGNANDSAGNINGTAINMTYPSSFKVAGNYSGYFNRNSPGYITIDGLNPYAYSSFSMALWIKCDTALNKCCFSFGVNSTDTDFIGIFGGNTSGTWAYYVHTSDGNLDLLYLNSAITSVDNNWHHIVVTDVNGSVTIYTDGGSPATGSYTRYSQTFNVGTIGVLRYHGTTPEATWRHHGNLDDVRFYDVALSAADVRALYNSYFTEKASNFLSML